MEQAVQESRAGSKEDLSRHKVTPVSPPALSPAIIVPALGALGEGCQLVSNSSALQELSTRGGCWMGARSNGSGAQECSSGQGEANFRVFPPLIPGALKS